jgi:hypothetical protein
MNNKRRKIVASVEVGKAQVVSEKHTILASFHGFESLPHERGAYCTRAHHQKCCATTDTRGESNLFLEGYRLILKTSLIFQFALNMKETLK